MEIEAFFPYQLAVAAASLSRQLEAVYRGEGGLSREEWRVLFLLANASELSSRELAQRSSLDKVQISRAAQRLVKKGLITGAEADQDRRLRTYACTPVGRSFFDALFSKVQQRAADVMAQMDPGGLDALRRGVRELNRAAGRMR